MATLLLTLLTSCASTPKVKVVQEVIVPELDFPDFPLADSLEYVGENRVEGDFQYFMDLAVFCIKYRNLQADYEELKALYEARNERNEIDTIH